MRNKFIKLLVGLAVLVGGVSAEAQNFKSLNFLLVPSITVSNKVQYTNLQSSATVANASTTNIVGLIWTNLFGNQVIAGVADFTQLSGDVPLWSDRNGNVPILTSGSNTVWSGAISALTMNIHLLTGGSAANSAVNFVFTPVFDGIHDSTASGDMFTVGVTAAGAAAVNIATNVPMWKWPGAKSLRLLTINNADTDASSQVVVDGISLNGFIP